MQATIDQQPVGGELRIPMPLVAYKISAPLKISKPLTILGEGSLIQQSKPGVGAFQINSSGVTLRSLNLQGTQFATQNSYEVAVQAVGPSAQANLLDIEISNCTIGNWGMYGILARYVDGFLFARNKIANINYGGIGGASVLNGGIIRNKIANIVCTPNAYGIIVTRDITDPSELVANPRSSNVLIDGNEVNGVPNWEGIDTHAGVKIAIVNNRVLNCKNGIVVTDCGNYHNIKSYGPKDCVVVANTIDSGKTDGSANFGIVVSGSSSAVGTPTDLAEGCTVEANTIRGYGASESPSGLAVYLLSTRGLTFSNNKIIEPGKIGICLDYNNYGFSCLGNTIQDVWSASQTTICVSCRSNWNRGILGGGSHVRGGKVANHVLDQGLYISNQANNWVAYSGDYSEAVLPLYDPGSHRH